MPTDLDFENLPGQIQSLAAVVDKLDPLSALDIPDGVEPASSDELETAAKQVRDLLDDSIQPAFNALDTVLKSLQSAVDEATQVTSDVQTSVETNAAKLDQAVDAFDLHVDDKGKEIRTVADGEYIELHQKLEGLHNATQALVVKAKEFAVAFPQRSEEFASQVGNNAMSKIEAQARQAGEALETSFNEVSMQLRASASALDAELQSQFGRLDQAVTSGISNHIESAGQRIVESALRQIAHAVAGSIAQMTVGVQLTSMMSPILPQMIVLNKCADALLALIEVHKKIKMGVL